MHICAYGVCTPSVLWCSCSFKVIQGGYTVRSVVLTCSRIAISNSIFAPFPNRSIQVHSETLFYNEISKTTFFRNCGFRGINGKCPFKLADLQVRSDWSIAPSNENLWGIQNLIPRKSRISECTEKYGHIIRHQKSAVSHLHIAWALVLLNHSAMILLEQNFWKIFENFTFVRFLRHLWKVITLKFLL